MSDVVLIGVAGKQLSGKDTIAEYLVDECGFERKGFSDFIKEMAMLLFDVSNQDLEVKDERVRKILQDLGQKMREVDAEVWVNQLMATFDGAKMVRDTGMTQKPLRWVVADVRFPNEVEVLQSRGGKVWKVERLNGPEGILMDHITETALDVYPGFDAVIPNTGTIQDLHDRVHQVLSSDEKFSYVLEPDETYQLGLDDA